LQRENGLRMSLLTRCPACTTLYKVVPDQLRISQGWVKCGQCGDIFDATQHLVHIQPKPPAEDRIPDQAYEVPLSGLDALPLPSDGNGQSDLDEQPPQEVPVEDDFQENVGVVEVGQMEAVGAPQVSEELALSSTVQEGGGQADQDAAAPEMPPSEVLPSALKQADAIATEAATGVEEPSFMRHARRALFWRRPWVRAVLLVLVLLLLLGLAAQWVYRERQLLSASHPQWTPALQSFCGLLGCGLEPLQRIESVSIDAASFNKIDSARYRLIFILKNSADVPLAVPSIELTLTDLQERVVMRRVFAARELDNNVALLRPASVWQVDTSLGLADETVAQRVVGYRLLAFYP